MLWRVSANTSAIIPLGSISSLSCPPYSQSCTHSSYTPCIFIPKKCLTREGAPRWCTPPFSISSSSQSFLIRRRGSSCQLSLFVCLLSDTCFWESLNRGRVKLLAWSGSLWLLKSLFKWRTEYITNCGSSQTTFWPKLAPANSTQMIITRTLFSRWKGLTSHGTHFCILQSLRKGPRFTWVNKTQTGSAESIRRTSTWR